MTRISPSTSSGGEAVGILDMGLFEAEPSRFEIGEHGFDAPALGIAQGGQISRLGRPRPAPGQAMAMIQGSPCPGSRRMPMLVVTRLPVRATASK